VEEIKRKGMSQANTWYAKRT